MDGTEGGIADPLAAATAAVAQAAAAAAVAPAADACTAFAVVSTLNSDQTHGTVS